MKMQILLVRLIFLFLPQLALRWKVDYYTVSLSVQLVYNTITSNPLQCTTMGNISLMFWKSFPLWECIHGITIITILITWNEHLLPYLMITMTCSCGNRFTSCKYNLSTYFIKFCDTPPPPSVIQILLCNWTLGSWVWHWWYWLNEKAGSHHSGRVSLAFHTSARPH